MEEEEENEKEDKVDEVFEFKHPKMHPSCLLSSELDDDDEDEEVEIDDVGNKLLQELKELEGTVEQVSEKGGGGDTDSEEVFEG